MGQGSVIVENDDDSDSILNKLKDINQMNEKNKPNISIIKNQMVNKLNEIELKKEKKNFINMKKVQKEE